MNRSYKLFEIAGVPVRLHRSFVFLGLLLVILALGRQVDGRETLLNLTTPLILFGVVFLHELGHTFVALKLGVKVVDIQLTPLGGVARIAGTLHEPRKEFLIAAAGPVVNLIVAGISIALIKTTGGVDLRTSEIFLLDGGRELLDRSPLEIFASFNIVLGTVNLFPAFPVDGGRIFRAALAGSIGRLRATRIACRLGFWTGIGLIIAPFFLEGVHWWILPFVGFFVIVGGVKERILVEAREGGLGQGVLFHAFRQGGGFPPGSTESPSQAPFDEQDPDPRGANDVIDVEGESRIVDESDRS